jgi:hypothetical protein
LFKTYAAFCICGTQYDTLQIHGKFEIKPEGTDQVEEIPADTE